MSGSGNRSDGLHALHFYEDADELARTTTGLLIPEMRLQGDSGASLIEWAATAQRRAALPITVYASSTDASDIRSAYALGATSYIVKKIDVQGLVGGVVAPAAHRA